MTYEIMNIKVGRQKLDAPSYVLDFKQFFRVTRLMIYQLSENIFSSLFDPSLAPSSYQGRSWQEAPRKVLSSILYVYGSSVFLLNLKIKEKNAEFNTLPTGLGGVV